MIEMWDNSFAEQNELVKKALLNEDGRQAFDLMHKVLDLTWNEAARVLRPGGFACINIGDATRTINKSFSLYSNHSRITSAFVDLGFSPLPVILWRKQTNAPNKFMGSGMLPAGAYVTLEHEYILVFRKGDKREFMSVDDKNNRRESALFWEERNEWFSDVWFDIKGTRQKLKSGKNRKRSGAFPFELAYRLISMYSVKGDTVLDPFMGTGTTTLAAIAACRNSFGFEIDESLYEAIDGCVKGSVQLSNDYNISRIERHLKFVLQRLQDQKEIKYINNIYGFPVVTRQEIELFISEITDIKKLNRTSYQVTYSDDPHSCFHNLSNDQSFKKDLKKLKNYSTISSACNFNYSSSQRLLPFG